MALVQKPFSDIITFTRASGGGRFNAQGQYEWLPANQPRIDYNPANLLPRGLLVEPQRTNLYINSQAIGASIGTMVISNSVLAPDKTTTADQIIETATVGEHYAQDRSLAFTAGTTYTFSAFAKALGVGDARRLYLRIAAGGNTFGTFFDLNNIAIL